MKYTILNRGDRLSQELTETFHRLAAEGGMTMDQHVPDIVISIGGDGTMLHAFHSHIHLLDKVSFVGVHTGHLGFYADWKATEIAELVKRMTTPDVEMKIVKYPIAEIEIVTKKAGKEVFYALNEFTIRGDDGKTLVAKINVNLEDFEMFRGDGICISTPSGSTAYNKSLQGALLHPSIEALQIAEIASINNRVYRTLGSSMILPKHHICDIFPREDQKLQLSVDHMNIQRDDILSIRSQVSELKVSFARYRPFPFWNRVRAAFIGNEPME
ncbi:inorganic polyphosphate kinase [Paenibacillus swuensis]|uniref:NAD kinase n=1 Tax=Paenibacillus swuensis TaxID=1178515 RepID=A0A172TDG0_9BACL|nr:NAD kinase [Paenibacillus swuensis]ANE45085.1 inorganic polyphosphate kinase [Paenibacillus swuensis]